MTTTYDEIKGFLNELDFSFKHNEEKGYIATGFGTKNYRDEDNDDHCPVIIKIDENGEFLKIFSPGLYHYKKGPNKRAVFQSCLMVCYQTKMIQYEYDEEDGEIRAIIEFPLEDAKLTQKQLKRILQGLIRIIDEYDKPIRTAIETGKVEFDGVGIKASMLRELGIDPELASLMEGMSPEEMKALVEQAKQQQDKGSAKGSAPDQL